MCTSAARNALAVRTTEPMLKSCASSRSATWNGCRRVSRSATIASQPPVAVAVDDVAPVAVREQLGVEPRVVRPRPDPRPDADLAGQLVGHRHTGNVTRSPPVACAGALSTSQLRFLLSSVLSPDHLVTRLGPDRAAARSSSPSAACSSGSSCPATPCCSRRACSSRRARFDHPLWLRHPAHVHRGGRRQPGRLRDRPRAPGPPSSGGPTPGCSGPSTSSARGRFFEKYGASPWSWRGSCPIVRTFITVRPAPAG